MSDLATGYLILGLLFALFTFVSGRNELLEEMSFLGRLLFLVLYVIFWFPLFVVSLIVVMKESRK